MMISDAEREIKGREKSLAALRKTFHSIKKFDEVSKEMQLNSIKQWMTKRHQHSAKDFYLKSEGELKA